MKVNQRHIAFRSCVFIMALVYAFIFVSHVFLLADLTTATSVVNRTVVSHRNTNTVTIQRTDKTIITKNNIPNTLSNYSHLYLFLRTQKNIAVASLSDLKNLNQILQDLHYSWLQNRVLKI